MSDSNYVPALGFNFLTPMYQHVVDIFCRDTEVKKQLLELVEGENLRILDIACGTGKLVNLLATKQKCCHITASDIDDDMVNTAMENTKHLGNVNVLKGDATDPPFESSSFDIVIECLMFHHLSDGKKREAIEQINRILCKNGLFYFVDWVKPQNFVGSATFKIVELLDGIENVRSHSDNSVLQMIAEVFSQQHIQFVETSLGTIAIATYKKID